MRRKRIDWDEEIRKSEQIRLRGLRYTIAAFVLAGFWLFAVGRMGKKDISLAPLFVTLLLIGAGTLLFFFLSRRKKK